jgi:hypothetical protein
VAAVDIGVGEDDDLVIAGLLGGELLADTTTDGGDQRLHLDVLEHLVETGSFDVEDLAADGQDRLDARVTRVDGGTAGGVTLDDEQLALVGVAAAAVLQLVGHARTSQRCLAADRVAGVLGGEPRLSRGDALLDDAVGLGRVLFQPLGESLVGGLLHERPHGDVAELGLGLTLELWLA